MIRIRDISLPPAHDDRQLTKQAARLLQISPSAIQALKIVRKSIDARKKPEVRVIYTVDVAVAGEETDVLRRSGCKKAAIAPEYRLELPRLPRETEERPVVVGFGPAGMFAALVLALAGCRPIVLERGADARSRHEKVERFFETGQLDVTTNVQFGEGGAGTFSDGKLNTGVSNPRIRWILEQLVQAGAQERILYDAKPHVGTDVLIEVVQALRKRIIALGGEVRFLTQVKDLQIQNQRLTGLVLSDGMVLPCGKCVLAIGHSARDTFTMLHDRGIRMEPKPFSMGVRIEHRQKDINWAQYGCENPRLPPADYKLAAHLENRTVYSFCMCPGGYVVAAASEPEGVVTNGMSNSDRGGENANAALLVTVGPEDFPEPGPLGGMQWQRQLERLAYQAGGGGYRAPAQLVGDFLAGRASTGPAGVQPTYRPGVTWCDLHTVLPRPITAALEEGIPLLERKLKGFSSAEAVLTASETRSSSPVRIVRDSRGQSSLAGLYPAGEGAGYAGGIMSAAIDGMMAAEALIQEMREESHE